MDPDLHNVGGDSCKIHIKRSFQPQSRHFVADLPGQLQICFPLIGSHFAGADRNINSSAEMGGNSVCVGG